MKKIFLLLITMLIATTCAKAVDWQPISTNIPNFDLYIDKDSISHINADECLYAIKYKSYNKPEQVAYLKSNSSNNYIGVINAGDFDENKYKPKAVFYNAHVFMKPINGDSFLLFAHNYAVNIVSDKTLAQAQKNEFTPPNVEQINLTEKTFNIENSNNIDVSYEIKLVPQKQSLAKSLKEYVEETANLIKDNWTPPISKKGMQAILIVQIGPDGSLQNYKFAKSSGNKTTDNSIINAIEKVVPYAGYSKITGNSESLILQFVFDNKLFKKSVI